MKCLFVTACFLPSPDGRRWHPWTVNGDELPHWREGPGLYAFVEQRRAEGWSLVFTYPVPVSDDTSTYRLDFLRLESK